MEVAFFVRRFHKKMNKNLSRELQKLDHRTVGEASERDG